MAQYQYQIKDFIYDIESFQTYNNLFTCVFKEPATNTIYISYFTSDKTRAVQGEPINPLKTGIYIEDCFENIQFRNTIEQKVRETFKALNKERQNEIYHFIWEDLSKLGFSPTIEQQKQGFQPIYGLQTFLQRLGFPKKDYNKDFPVKIEQYLANFDDEKEQNPNLNGYLFGFNSHNYDETMLAMILGEIIENTQIANIAQNILLNIPNTNELQSIENSLIQQLKEDTIFFNPVDFVFKMNPYIDYFQKNDPMQFVINIAQTNLKFLLNERIIRENYNDMLFDTKYKSNMKSILRNDTLCSPYAKPIYDHWKRTGRFIDITIMVENMHTALKRLLGVKGFRIQESENLSNNRNKTLNIENLINDIIYNVSDVIGTQILFEDKMYQTKFTVKKDLLKEYPYIVYDNNNQIKRYGRATADSTSASLIAQVIAKDGEALTDIPVVDFTYPSPHAISYLKSLDAYKDMNIKPSDILENTLEWFIRNVCKFNGSLPKKKIPRYNFIMKTLAYDYDIELIDSIIKQNCSNKRYQAFLAFKDVYLYYDFIRGKNMNRSELYHERLLETYLKPEHLTQTQDALAYLHYKRETDLNQNAFKAYSSSDIAQFTDQYNTNIFYFDNEGNPTTCFATFALGGIHGQEINGDLYKNEVRVNKMLKAFQDQLKQQYKTAKKALDHKEEWSATILTKYLIQESGEDAKNKRVAWKKIDTTEEQKLFKKSKKQDKERFELNDKYKYISVGTANHEDFTSYYPMLIVNLAIFRKFADFDPTKPIDLNEEIVDEYLSIYVDRARLKKLSKDENESKEVRADASRKQETKKLLLNSGSGAADASYDTLIRKNNAIISMRIIGQLFAYTIGQAQALAGARVPSTNTDGLYTMDIDVKLNEEILEDVSKGMYIGIEPELVHTFISKDSNNRLEAVFSHKEQKEIIADAKGGTLTSHKQPVITKNLDHPAIIDKALSYYLWKKPNAVNEAFDQMFAQSVFREIYQEYAKKNELNELLRMYQWMIASSPGTLRFVFKRESNGIFTIEKPMQHYNRLFLTKALPNEQITTYGLVTKYKINTKTKNIQQLMQLVSKEHKTIEDIEMIKALYPYSDPIAYDLLKSYHVDLSEFNAIELTNDEIQQLSAEDIKPYKAILTKIKSLDENQNGKVINDNILIYSEKQALDLLNELDEKAYLRLLQDTFESSWQNKVIPQQLKDLAQIS